MEPTSIAGVPFSFEWDLEPEIFTNAGSLSMRAGPLTDLFLDPAGGAPAMNAPRLLGTPDGDFSLSARVEVDFAADFDAGVLMVYATPEIWAKLCFEFSPQRRPMVVSVVTREFSDDANGFVAQTSSIWLRVSRRGAAYAFHASPDGAHWEFVRHFALDSAEPMQVGFVAQSPRGDGCTATFADVVFTSSPPGDLRDGS